MKFHFIVLGLVLLLCVRCSPAKAFQTDPVVTHYSYKLTKFFEENRCHGKPCGDKQWVHEYTVEQVKWLRFFRIRAETKYLAALVKESWFNPDAIGKFGERGVTQVYSVSLADGMLRKRGIDPKRLNPVQLQAARGAAVYKHKLRVAKGDPWLGLKLYNGWGPEAEKYRNKVWELHRQIFEDA